METREHMRAHQEWLVSRPKTTSRSIAKALEILDRPANQPQQEDDELPVGYVSVRRKYASKKAAGSSEG